MWFRCVTGSSWKHAPALCSFVAVPFANDSLEQPNLLGELNGTESLPEEICSCHSSDESSSDPLQVNRIRLFPASEPTDSNLSLKTELRLEAVWQCSLNGF